MPDRRTIVRAARANDLEAVLGLLSEAAKWWATLDVPSPWPYPFPPERVRPSFDRGEVYVAEIDGKPPIVGTYTLIWSDPRFWGERPPDAGYLHRIAIDRRHAGAGIGRAIIEDAYGRIRAAGRSIVRLDTQEANRRLCEYYVGLGFRPLGTVTVDGVLCRLFERSV